MAEWLTHLVRNEPQTSPVGLVLWNEQLRPYYLGSFEPPSSFTISEAQKAVLSRMKDNIGIYLELWVAFSTILLN